MSGDLMGAFVIGDRLFQKYVTTKAVGLDPAIEKLVHTVTELTKTKIQSNASGRPGPNAPTGDYRRSWTTSYRKTGGTVTGVAGTNKPQGRRLEYGFHGADSLGRVYNQSPFPHVGPAFEWGTQLLARGADSIGASL